MKLIRRPLVPAALLSTVLLVVSAAASCAAPETSEAAVDPEGLEHQVAQEQDHTDQDKDKAKKQAKQDGTKKEKAKKDKAKKEKAAAKNKNKKKAKPVDRSDAEYEELIGMLEHGMMALDELGAKSELKRLDKVAGKLRKEREAANKRRKKAAAVAAQKATDRRLPEMDKPLMGELRVRLKVLSAAAASFQKAGHESGARRLRQAVNTGELQLSGANQEKVIAAYDAGPQPGELIELLHRGAILNGQNGNYKLSELCLKLANHYSSVRHKMRDGQGSKEDRTDRRRESRTLNLQDRATRVEVLRRARDAHRRAGDAHAVEVLNVIIHVGELQVKGASQEEISKAITVRMTMETVIGHVQGAARLYSEWNREELSKTCAALAEFYAKREADRNVERR